MRPDWSLKKGDPKVPFFIADAPAEPRCGAFLLGKQLDPGDIRSIPDPVSHLQNPRIPTRTSRKARTDLAEEPTQDFTVLDASTHESA